MQLLWLWIKITKCYKSLVQKYFIRDDSKQTKGTAHKHTGQKLQSQTLYMGLTFHPSGLKTSVNQNQWSQATEITNSLITELYTIQILGCKTTFVVTGQTTWAASLRPLV